MTTIWSRLNHCLPFGQAERIIIVLVLFIHALFFVSLQNSQTADDHKNEADNRITANLVSPDTPKAPAAVQNPPPPKSKPEQKQEPAQKPKQTSEQPKPPSQNSASAPKPSESKSESPAPTESVAPASNSGNSGTPIHTDIGKLIVVFAPDANAYYPSFSKRSGEQGEVVVQLIIDNKTGLVESIVLLRSSTFPKLDRAAIELAQRYRFKPAVDGSAPAKISTVLAVKFNLKS
jgi:protein TonB